MGIIHPADGLINRLLKQNVRPAPAPAVDVDAISPADHQANSNVAAAVQTHGVGRRLESQLLQLYRANRGGKNKEP